MPRFGDTPRFDGTSLCKSCRSSHIMKGQGMSDELTLCRASETGLSAFRVFKPVVECSSYENKATPALYQLEKVAWRLSVDNRKKTMGFLSAADWQKKVKDEGIEEPDLPAPF